jgi:hypothetical protein
MINARALLVLAIGFGVVGLIRLSQPSPLDLAAEIAIPTQVFYDVSR